MRRSRNEPGKWGVLLLKRTNRALDDGKTALGAAGQPPGRFATAPFFKGELGNGNQRPPKVLLDDGLMCE
jgi:hypothetical protein